ncbi:MAG: hypothetical protein ACYDAO_04430 [Thermoplasmataceae archaeon]
MNKYKKIDDRIADLRDRISNVEINNAKIEKKLSNILMVLRLIDIKDALIQEYMELREKIEKVTEPCDYYYQKNQYDAIRDLFKDIYGETTEAYFANIGIEQEKNENQGAVSVSAKFEEMKDILKGLDGLQNSRSDIEKALKELFLKPKTTRTKKSNSKGKEAPGSSEGDPSES